MLSLGTTALLYRFFYDMDAEDGACSEGIGSSTNLTCLDFCDDKDLGSSDSTFSTTDGVKATMLLSWTVFVSSTVSR